MNVSPGMQFGPYVIIAQIGAGGMGEVYKARDPRLDRMVAVKVLPSSFAQDQERLSRFESEARAIAGLNHPGILQIYDVGQHDGVPFLVTELLEGRTLREELLEKGAMKPRTAIKFAVEFARALAFAHEKGIVHRDLKPENIYITVEGRLKILDFGLAKFTKSQNSISHQDATLDHAPSDTTPGKVLGTVGYMSPEQVRGQVTDHRSDIFAFGAILYEMLTGSRAFHAESSAADTMSAILRDEPPQLRDLGTMASPGLERIARRCLEKQPDQRFQNANDLAFALESLTDTSSSVTSAVFIGQSAPRRKWMLPAVAALALVALIATGIYLLRGKSPLAANEIRSVAVLPISYPKGNDALEFWADGVTESIINSLSQKTDLKVIARSTVFRFKGKDDDPRSVGDQLKVDAVLTGRLAQRDGQIYVQTELVRVSDGAQIWGEQYMRTLAEMTNVHLLIAQEVASRAKSTMTGGMMAGAKQRDARAYEAFLRGNALYNRRSRLTLMQAMTEYKRALEIDPSFADAEAALASVYLTLPGHGVMPFKEANALGAEHLEKALALDPNNPGAYFGRGSLVTTQLQWAEAEADYKKGFQLSPQATIGHYFYAIRLLMPLQRFKEAEEHMKSALDSDPLSPIINTNYGLLLLEAGREKEALAQWEKVDSIEPTYLPLAVRRFEYYVAIGEWQKGFAYVKQAVPEEFKDVPEPKQVKELLTIPFFQRTGAAGLAARVGANMDNKQKVFEILQKEADDDTDSLLLLLRHPLFKPLHNTPEWTQFLKRLKLEK